MKKYLVLIFCLFIGCQSFANEVHNLSAEDALSNLKAGNERFKAAKYQHPHQTKTDRLNSLKGQHPYAAILTCSDSRVPAEIIFDQGLGDIFVIRNAGNVLDEHVIGSIEYAVVHLGVKLVVIMGHDDCGAVNAAIKNGHESKYVDSLVKDIQPAVKMYEQKKQAGCMLENVIKNNAVIASQDLTKKDSVLKDYVQNKGVKIVPAYYHFESGDVEFLTK